MAKRRTQQEVAAIFANKGYALLSVYKNNNEPLNLTCDNGHPCKMTLKRFLLGQLCQVCSGVPNWDTEKVKDFLKSFPKKEHYELIGEYVTAKKEIILKCPDPEHPPYKTKWVQFHMEKKRCKQCFHKSRRVTLKAVRSYAESRGYTLLTNNYSPSEKIVLKCQNGHDFEVRWNHFFSKNANCPQCNHNSPVGIEKFRALASDKGFKVLNSKYINSKTPILVECHRKGHHTNRSYNQLLNYGCPDCYKESVSAAELELLKSFPGFTPKHHFQLEIPESLWEKQVYNKRSMEVDLFFPEKMVAIEYCGLYWHSELNIQDDELAKRVRNQKRHRFKYDVCKELGIRLFTVFEDEFFHQKEVVISRIGNSLGLSKRVFARKCTVLEATKEETAEFLKKYHLQGNSPRSFGIKLICNNETLGVMTFGHPARAHVAKPGTMELKRLCFKPGIAVIGGTEKMFNLAKKKLKGKSVVSFCDLRYGTGGVYKRLGFTLDKEVKQTPHVILKDKETSFKYKRYRYQTFAKSGLDQKFLPKIYDCGHQKWILDVE